MSESSQIAAEWPGRTSNRGPQDKSSTEAGPPSAESILATAKTLRWEIGGDFHMALMESIYTDAARIADRAVTRPDEKPKFDLDRTIDGLVTSRLWGFPIMLLLFTVVFWLTITGANIPSQMLSDVLIGKVYPALLQFADTIGMPWWLSGLLIDGVYLATAWVISVMLPPMAIFFPLFTLLEDFGYLPRVAFNLDNIFKKSGAHGKQSLSMMMGFGCNAAGVVATRIIDSPRERFIAIITNNFALCNGRWPTQILIATLFIGALVRAELAGLVSALAVVGIAVLGVLLSFAVSWGLSRTVLKGEVSTFSLELPPYRPPRVLRTIYTSLIDRTAYVLWRAIVFAAPAGAIIWLIANVYYRRREHRRDHGQCPQSAGCAPRPERHHPGGLHRGHPGQRDRDPHHSDVDRVDDRLDWHRGWRRRHDCHGQHPGYDDALPGRRLDAADGRQSDAVQPDPQPVQHDDLHDLQRNGQPSMDHGGGSVAAGHGLRRDLRGGAGVAVGGGDGLSVVGGSGWWRVDECESEM